MNAVGKSIGGVVGEYLATCLEDNFATIYFFIYMMNCYATLGVTGCENSFVNMMPIHTGTSVQG